eukprot:TRINITY_DN19484_c1_g1_i3.p1 TRINITY_DN19484_c1_g1~~TRINITY_DN19484_c1_g1_i3.p1  ORF type:complete len:148 (-),score=24.50 TRINITY_DN19484_c1_g1_i3:101-544(-)
MQATASHVVNSLIGIEDDETDTIEVQDPHWQATKRVLWFAVLVLAYGRALSEDDGDRRESAAAWREILGELHPDNTKNTERLTEAEVVPKWSEVMHSDDVTKHLDWFQTFCREKHGMDDHIKFYWRCEVILDMTSTQWAEGARCLRI